MSMFSKAFLNGIIVKAIAVFYSLFQVIYFSEELLVVALGML